MAKCAECGKKSIHGYYGKELCGEHYVLKRIKETGYCGCACSGCMKAKVALGLDGEGHLLGK